MKIIATNDNHMLDVTCYLTHSDIDSTDRYVFDGCIDGPIDLVHGVYVFRDQFGLLRIFPAQYTTVFERIVQDAE